MGGQQIILPEWVVWVQALAPVFTVPILGLVAAWIAHRQWRTADRKVQLDLFDRRFALYDAARDALKPVLRKGGADTDDCFAFASAIDKAPFLFGNEVVKQLKATSKDISQLGMFSSRMSSGPPYDPEVIEGRAKYMLKVGQFFTVMAPLIEPYMDLSHKPGRRRKAWWKRVFA